MEQKQEQKHVFVGLFSLGLVFMTPGAIEIPEDDRISALTRHIAGDWGEVSKEDAASNDVAVKSYERILSVYISREGVRFWIITEADRSITTFLLPDEY